MNAKELRENWRRAMRRQLAALGKLLRRRAPLNAAAVHDLRVVLRRCRLLLSLGGKSRQRARRRAFRSAARTVLDHFGPVRDLDVTIEWAGARRAPTALLASLGRRRTSLALRAFHAMAKLRPSLHPSRVRKTLRTDPDKLARRHRRWQDALAAHCRAEAGRADKLSTARLHALRRDIRRWRYLRELEPRAKRPSVATLVAAQEALGGVQNSEVALDTLRCAGAPRELTGQARLELAAGRKLAPRELSRRLAPGRPNRKRSARFRALP